MVHSTETPQSFVQKPTTAVNGSASGAEHTIRSRLKAGFDYQQPLAWGVRLGLGVAAWCLLLGLWQYAATADLFPRRLFPPPTDVLEALVRLFVERGFMDDVLASLQRISVSFLLAAGFAVPLGVLMGAFPVVGAFFNPLVSPFRYLPAPAFLPLLMMWLGADEKQKIALLFLGVVWFLVTLVMDNTRQVRMELVETARTLGASRRQVVLTVITRAALPSIVDTCRQMIAVSWTYLVIAEIVVVTDGIGAMMMRARRFVNVDEVMAGIVMIGVLGFLIDALFRLLHWWLFPHLRRRNR